jgi:hypothetical protein
VAEETLEAVISFRRAFLVSSCRNSGKLGAMFVSTTRRTGLTGWTSLSTRRIPVLRAWQAPLQRQVAVLHLSNCSSYSMFFYRGCRLTRMNHLLSGSLTLDFVSDKGRSPVASGRLTSPGTDSRSAAAGFVVYECLDTLPEGVEQCGVNHSGVSAAQVVQR